MTADDAERIIDQLQHALADLPPDVRDGIEPALGLLSHTIEQQHRRIVALTERLTAEREVGIRALCQVQRLRRRWRRHRRRVQAVRSAARAFRQADRFDPIGLTREEESDPGRRTLPADGIGRLLRRTR